MAVQRRPHGSGRKCDECGKPLYRPKTCRKCGGTFCRDHITSRKHTCIDAEKEGGRLPWKRVSLAAALSIIVVVSVIMALWWLPKGKRKVIDVGERGLRIGPYLQYFREDLRASARLEGLVVRDFAILGGDLWAATNDGVYSLKGKSWKREDAGLPSADAYCLGLDEGSLLLGLTGGVFKLKGGEWEPLGTTIPGERATALVRDGDGRIWLGTDGGIAVLEEDTWKGFDATFALKVRSLGSMGGGVIAGTDQGLWRFAEGNWENLTGRSGEMGLPSADIRKIVVNEDGDAWVCTAGGVSVFDGRDYYYTFVGSNGLPYEDTTCVAFEQNGTVWVGTTIGLCELREGRWHYYQGRRWLENDMVHSIVASSDGSVWLGTDSGVSKIYGTWMTLEDKARMIDKIVQQRHERDGFIEFISLKSPGDFSQNWTYHASDNDGLWTSIYLAAESFRYAVTGEPKAKQNAKKSYEAMKRLEELSGIAGFPARAAVRKDSTGVVKSGGEWHDSSVDRDWEWKGDTSSDEIDGHYFALAIYHDLVADEREKRDVAALVARITDHIIDHDYYLVDLDGKRTRWGVWNPKEINDDPSWAEEHGLNALEILSHIKVAIHMTGAERFERAYKELIQEYHYHLNTISQKIVPPGSVNHSDDELAFLAYYPLMIYEDDPYLRSIYLKSIERSWRIERPERSPFFNFVYGAATGADFDLEDSVEELKGMSPDLLDWSVMNSHRSDVQARLEAGEVFTLPFENRNMRRWNANPYNLDWGGSGGSEGDGAYFLMPYWMGRYHGFIIEGG